MKKKIHKVTIMLLVFAAFPGSCGKADSALEREYQVKAAFVYNFVKFVDGGRFGPVPEEGRTDADPNAPIVVGVLGDLPFTEAFAGLRGKQARARPIVVRCFRGFGALRDDGGDIPERHPDLEAVRKCHVLFICPSEKPFLQRILPFLCVDGILTVGDVPGFLQAGGVANLLIVEKKVRFELNLAAAARAKLQFRSSLLRLAVRIVDNDQLERQDDEAGQDGR